ncbi:hypothetical protein SAMN05216466_10135 [Paraburkholderia phenazinium]|jgi:hypothetical protein|uniref:Uncharacterized protein n=1 Tax=Paraburkholderia phenazinium TaxID=60549 RepID=A0A1G7NU01_9BURK|nr:hypothetical protein [Paraburkholderia phenazinium]SDF77516.1 hypothetical protein SAMN05216466_10135 [Paraburkholderia phenazinium]
MGIKKAGAAIEADTREPLLLRMLIRLAVAAGAVVRLARLMVSWAAPQDRNCRAGAGCSFVPGSRRA